jgi:hypothetical protein
VVRSEKSAIEDVLWKRLTPDAADWFQEALARASEAGTLGARWSGAGRRLGRAPLALTADELRRLAAAPFVPQGWGADECGRALMVLAATEALHPGAQLALVEELYRTGEMRERQAVLRVLAALPDPARFTPLAVEAVRANVLPEIEAIACENPFPARHFTEEAFNQMVLKCLFNAIPLGGIVGLAPRRTPELARMVAAFASERRAAGRPVPADAALVLDGGTDASV